MNKKHGVNILIIFVFLLVYGAFSFAEEVEQRRLPVSLDKIYNISQAYKTNLSHYNKETYALDFADKNSNPEDIYGDSVFAVASGKITSWDGNHFSKTYGQNVEIDHGDGVYSRYAHLSAIPDNIVKGLSVEKGDLIGYIGNTGYVEPSPDPGNKNDRAGTHLHFVMYTDTKESDCPEGEYSPKFYKCAYFAEPLSGCVGIEEGDKLPDENKGCGVIDVADKESAKLPVEITIKKIEDEDEIDESEDMGKLENINDTKLYRNEKLGIEFYYPSSWGGISQVDDDHYPDCGLFVRLIIKDNIPIVAGVSVGMLDPLGRPDGCGFGTSGWAFLALPVNNQEYIAALCDKKNKAESCELKTNSAGIPYVKVVEEVNYYIENAKAINYYIFNPNSKYHGLILSTGGEHARGWVAENIAGELDLVVESLSFIE